MYAFGSFVKNSYRSANSLEHSLKKRKTYNAKRIAGVTNNARGHNVCTISKIRKRVYTRNFKSKRGAIVVLRSV